MVLTVVFLLVMALLFTVCIVAIQDSKRTDKTVFYVLVILVGMLCNKNYFDVQHFEQYKKSVVEQEIKYHCVDAALAKKDIE